MERAELPVVDVNVDSASFSWPLLLRAVQEADFIALDLVNCMVLWLLALRN